jgi:S-adenosylmethionine hydrolase
LQQQVITFITDFGKRDLSMVVLKQEIFNHFNNVHFVDINQQISFSGLLQSVYLSKTTIPFFKNDSIHFVLVDIFGSINNKLCIAKVANKYIVGIDNGFFDITFKEKITEFIIIEEVLTRKNYLSIFLQIVINIFENRGIANLGKPATPHIRKNNFEPITENNVVKGIVWYIDDNGNAVTNIHATTLMPFDLNNFKLNFGTKHFINRLDTHLYDVSDSSLIAYLNDFDFLEIAIKHHHFAKLFSIKENAIVNIDFKNNDN